MLQGEHSAILLTFIKLPFVVKTFVLSIFGWPLKTGFTVFDNLPPCSSAPSGAICQGEHSAILSTFIKLPFVIKTFVLSIFGWPFYTGFTV